MTPRLTIICPTSGRPTLERMLESMLMGGFSRDDDDVIVVGDGPQPEARRICEKYKETKMKVAYLETPVNHCVGHPQRNFGMPLATGTHIMSMDDDDVYTKDAVTIVRKKVAQNPTKINIFRMNQKNGWGTVWKEPVLKQGNVGTPLFAVPNHKKLLGRWGDRYEGDFDFIKSTVEKWKKETKKGESDILVWCEEIIVQCH